MKIDDLSTVLDLHRVRADAQSAAANVAAHRFAVSIDGSSRITDPGLLSTIEDDVRAYLMRCIEAADASLVALGVDVGEQPHG